MVSRTFQADFSNDIIDKVTALERIASCCKCQVFVSTEEHQTCADSVMGLFVLFNGTKEQTITVSVDGANEQVVMKNIAMIFDSL